MLLRDDAYNEILLENLNKIIIYFPSVENDNRVILYVTGRDRLSVTIV